MCLWNVSLVESSSRLHPVTEKYKTSLPPYSQSSFGITNGEVRVVIPVPDLSWTASQLRRATVFPVVVTHRAVVHHGGDVREGALVTRNNQRVNRLKKARNTCSEVKMGDKWKQKIRFQVRSAHSFTKLLRNLWPTKYELKTRFKWLSIQII